MYHRVNNLQSKSGDAFVGYYVKLKDMEGNYASLYSDTNLTPIINVSGLADAAKTNAEGMYDIYVEDGIYDEEYFDALNPDLLLGRIPAIPMFANTSVEAATEATLAVLASTDTGDGASRVVFSSGETVQDLASTETGKGGYLIGNIALPVSTRTALKALDKDRHLDAFLCEGLRFGYFRWDSSDLSTKVAADPAEAIYVPDGDGSGGAWVRQYDGLLNIGWFGAKFDLSEVATVGAATDDTDAWKAAIAYLREVGWGGGLQLPAGASLVTENIPILADNTIRIVGTAARKNYPAEPGSGTYDPYEPGEPCSSLLVPVHAEEDAITVFVEIDGQGGVHFENFSIATLETGDVPKAGIGFDTRGHVGSTAAKFDYGATLRNISIHGFKRASFGEAVRVYNSDGSATLPNGGVGALDIIDCNFNFNNWALRTSDNTIINALTVSNNQLGKNSVGGISILGGQNIAIRDSIMESTPNPIWVGGSGFFGCVIENMYFEANTGDQCIYVRERSNFRIGSNNYNGVNTTHKVMLVACQSGYCGDPFWSKGCVKVEGIRGALNNSGDTLYYRADDFNGKNWGEAPLVVSKRDVANSSSLIRAVHPGNGQVMPATAHDTTSAIFLDYAVGTAITASGGDWLMASMLLRRLDVVNADPVMRLTTTSAAQTQDFTFNYVQARFLDDEWMILTAAMKLASALSGNTTVRIYPYGTSAASGLISHMCHPFIAAVDNVNKVRAYASPMLNRVESSAPGGSFVAEQGDILWKRSGGAGASPGFYYVAASSAWKDLANIAA